MYSTSDVALALGLELKRLDNILVRHCRASLPSGGHGTARVIQESVVERLAVALLLQRDLGMPLQHGWPLAEEIISSHDGRVPVGTLGTLGFDVRRLRAVVRQALADAVQDRTPVRRGRPPLDKKRGAPL
ncbi:MAG: hypothetical protein O2973_10900 [Gemmatimonadetes bacterium]|nr:hypothetical protein [Gemmatimonadota bacterium]